jgi:LacI family transcriptional regulator
LADAVPTSEKSECTLATLKDISRILGISKSQVSAALRGNADVSQETRRRVKEAAKALNYSPNLSAQRLVSGQSGMVAMVVRQHDGLTRDTTFVESVAGLSRQFSSRNMQFILHIATESEPPEQTYGQLISAGAIDGFVLTEPEPNDARIDLLKSRNIPFVVHGNTGKDSDFPYFEIDNFGVGFRLAKHLVKKGHKKIALLNGRAGLNSAFQRQSGVEAVLHEVDTELLPELTRNQRFSEDYGSDSLTQMFTSDCARPTAVICGNMSIAHGVYQAAEALGLCIPDNLSVVAHDDCLPQYDSAGFDPALTVTASALADSWGPLADILVRNIGGKKLHELQVFRPIEFIARNSVSEPPARD